MSEAFSWGHELVGDRVYDALGHRVGRVVAVDEAAGMLSVAPTARTARRLGLGDVDLAVPFREIVNADDHDVTLTDVDELLLHPERRATPI